MISPQEFPRIDDRRTGLRYRYGYSVEHVVRERALEPTGTLRKNDVDTGRAASRSFGSDIALSEFTFVADPDRAGEDDGVLMGYATNVLTGRTSLQIIDAQSVEVVATVSVPQRIPFGFHGNWLPHT